MIETPSDANLLQNFGRTVVQTISIVILGRLGTRELASANLGNLTVNVFGYAVQTGLISLVHRSLQHGSKLKDLTTSPPFCKRHSSLDTLANQAIRSSSPKLTSIYTMRAFVVCCIMMPPMFIVLWNSESLISFVIPHADPEMIRLAALYVKITSLGIPVCSLSRYITEKKLRHPCTLKAIRCIRGLETLSC